MARFPHPPRFAVALLAVCAAAVSATEIEASWPNWRGPDGTGTAVGAPPIQWSESENIRWKVPLTGAGQSTPVVWGDRIFFPAARSSDAGRSSVHIPDSKEQPRGVDPKPLPLPEVNLDFVLVCVSLETGGTLWESVAVSTIPHQRHHPAGSFAPQSAVTDGTLVWASFGSRGIHCFDFEGTLRWSQALDAMDMKLDFGEGGSPALAGDVVVVVQDHEGQSRIRAFDKVTGEPRWSRDRDEGSSWTSPIALEVNGKWRVITAATRKIRAYDAASGEAVWEIPGLTNNTVPTPVPGQGRVYCASNFKAFSVKAIELGESEGAPMAGTVAWSLEEAAPYIPTPVLRDRRLYMIEDIKPLLSCVNADTGALVYTRERLPGLRQIFASPVAAGGRLYIPDRGGKTAVVALGDTFEILSVNQLDDGFDASPVVVGDSLLLKGNRSLYRIAED